jgi:hypothetical protein
MVDAPTHRRVSRGRGGDASDRTIPSQEARPRAGGRGTAVPVGPPACLAVTSVTLDGCPSRVPPSEAACHAHTGADRVWTHHRP